MAKASLHKATLIQTSESKNCVINNVEVKISQYLPIDDKSKFITEVMSSAIDDNNIFSPIRIKVYFDLNIIKFYTNFNLTDKMYGEPSKTYDLLVINNVISKVVENIPKEEYDFLYESLMACINDLRNYNQSAAGVLRQVAADYSTTNMDVDSLVQKLGDPEQFALVRDVLQKLG